jgi:hypothetical protein
MGTLNPGATYIYERVGGTVYAREFGADPKDRKVIGYNYDPNNEHLQSFADQYFIETEWREIIRESRNNPTLQEAIDRVKILYHLSRKDVKE